MHRVQFRHSHHGRGNKKGLQVKRVIGPAEFRPTCVMIWRMGPVVVVKLNDFVSGQTTQAISSLLFAVLQIQTRGAALHGRHGVTLQRFLRKLEETPPTCRPFWRTLTVCRIARLYGCTKRKTAVVTSLLSGRGRLETDAC